MEHTVDIYMFTFSDVGYDPSILFLACQCFCEAHACVMHKRRCVDSFQHQTAVTLVQRDALILSVS